MADYLIKEETLVDIADAIRSKTESSAQITPLEMPSKIRSITTSSGENVQPEQTVTPTEYEQIFPTNPNYTAVRKVTVNPIPSDYIKPSGTYPITSNGNAINVKKYAYVNVAVPTTIPSGYHDTSGVTATAATVLSPYKFVDKDGNTVDGAMPNIGEVYPTIESNSDSYTIPKGYHNGNGKVTVNVTMPTEYGGSISIDDIVEV